MGVRPKGAAEELGVEAAFVTNLVSDLTKKGLVESKADTNDSRAKYLHITEKGVTFMDSVEPKLHDAMRPLLKNISFNELSTYLIVLEKIIENDTH